MTPQEMKRRTFLFAIEIIRFVRLMPDTDEAKIIRRQLIRSAASVGANYRAACRAKSPADFVNKMTIVEEESDECCYWLEIIIELKLTKTELARKLLKEADEITAIVVSSVKTAKSNSSFNK